MFTHGEISRLQLTPHKVAFEAVVLITFLVVLGDNTGSMVTGALATRGNSVTQVDARGQASRRRSAALGKADTGTDPEVGAEQGSTRAGWLYKLWTKVNLEPVPMDPSVAFLCAPPSIVGAPGYRGNPHRRHFLTVYVNDLGKNAMLHDKNPVFPEGSTIIKEKLPSMESDRPELLTVMVKREAGFNPAGGDWEYIVTDGTGTRVSASGKLERCQSCHASNKSTDYVFRSYLSREAQSRLR
jgi:hypothetical protein